MQPQAMPKISRSRVVKAVGAMVKSVVGSLAVVVMVVCRHESLQVVGGRRSMLVGELGSLAEVGSN